MVFQIARIGVIATIVTGHQNNHHHQGRLRGLFSSSSLRVKLELNLLSPSTSVPTLFSYDDEDSDKEDDPKDDDSNREGSGGVGDGGFVDQGVVFASDMVAVRCSLCIAFCVGSGRSNSGLCFLGGTVSKNADA